MDAYDKGLSGPMAAFAVKKYSGHRGVSVAVEELLNQQADSAAVPEGDAGFDSSEEACE